MEGDWFFFFGMIFLMATCVFAVFAVRRALQR